ncbi:MAG: hypothetical protein HYY02_13815 [Chloroflexi bacterium]|nr:hypothetical protein [Chloroflexota bacterium]
MAAALHPAFPEGTVFHSYHAFESIACATLASMGTSIPNDHRQKLTRFQVVARHSTFFQGALVIAARLETVRNRALYPKEREQHSFGHNPSSAWSAAEAQRLLQRVDGTVNAIKTELRI